LREDWRRERAALRLWVFRPMTEVRRVKCSRRMRVAWWRRFSTRDIAGTLSLSELDELDSGEEGADDRRIEPGDIESNNAAHVSRSSCEDGAIIHGSGEDDVDEEDEGRDSWVGEARVNCASWRGRSSSINSIFRRRRVRARRRACWCLRCPLAIWI